MTLILLVALLRVLGRPTIWAAIYWWNPLILKELFNGAHMDALLAPFVLLALYGAIRKWHLAATASISLAVGIKIWPLLLIPIIWRPLLGQWRILCVAIVLSAAIIGLMAAPFVSVGLNPGSGLVAYASTWRISAPLYGLIEMATAMIKDSPWPASSLARAFVATCIGTFAMLLNIWPANTPEDLVRRATLIVAALLFLSPAIYPWYVAWLLPLLALTPMYGLLLLTVTAPLYYARFFYGAAERYEFFEMYIVWLIWVPVWLACGYQLIRYYLPLVGKSRGARRSRAGRTCSNAGRVMRAARRPQISRVDTAGNASIGHKESVYVTSDFAPKLSLKYNDPGSALRQSTETKASCLNRLSF